MFKDLKIQWQIVIGQSLLCIFLITFMWISSYAFLGYLMNFLQTSSRIILNKQLAHSSESVFSQIQYAMEQDFRVLRRQLESLSMVYSYTQHNNLQFQYDVEPVLNSYDRNYPIPYSSSFSYGVFGNTTETDYNDLLQLSDTLTTLYFANDQYSLYFSGVGEEQYYSINHGDPYGGYKPHSREWFLNQIANNQSLFEFSDPYSSYFGGVYMTQTSLITNQTHIRAVSAIDINMTGFADLNLNFDFLEVIVTTRLGLLAICDYYEDGLQDIDYMFTETLTGFNSSDFQYNLADQTTVSNTCNVELNNSVCLNDINGTEYNFMAAFTSDPDLIVLTKIQSSVYNTPLDALLVQFQYQWDQLIRKLLYTLFAGIVINIIASLLLDYLIIKPIKSLNLFTSNLYYKDIKSNHNLQLKTSCQEITQLNYAFYDFINQSRIDKLSTYSYLMMMKSDYPKRSHFVSYSIYQMNYKLRNYDYFIDEYSYKAKDRQKANDMLFPLLKQLS